MTDTPSSVSSPSDPSLSVSLSPDAQRGRKTSYTAAEGTVDPSLVFALTYLGETLDKFDTLAEAKAARRELVARIKRNELPDFLDADDIDGVRDFGIVRRRDG